MIRTELKAKKRLAMKSVIIAIASIISMILSWDQYITDPIGIASLIIVLFGVVELVYNIGMLASIDPESQSTIYLEISYKDLKKYYSIAPEKYFLIDNRCCYETPTSSYRFGFKNLVEFCRFYFGLRCEMKYSINNKEFKKEREELIEYLAMVQEDVNAAMVKYEKSRDCAKELLNEMGVL